MGGVVLRERRMAHDDVGIEDAVGGDVIRGASRCFIPTGGELVAHANAHGEVWAEADGILQIPGSFGASPAELVGIGNDLKGADGALQQRGQTGKGRLAKLTGGAVFVIAERLDPDSGGDLMNALDKLDLVVESKEIAAIPRSRGVVRTGRGDAGDASGGDASVDDDAPGSAAGDEGEARWKRR